MNSLRTVLAAASIVLTVFGAVAALAASDTPANDDDTVVAQPCITNADGKPGASDGSGANGGKGGTINLNGKTPTGCVSANGGNGGQASGSANSGNGGQGGTIKF